MPGLPSRDQLHAQSERIVASSNDTLHTVLGGRRKSWMVEVPGNPVRPTPRPPSSHLSREPPQALARPQCPKANATVLPSPAPSDEPSPVLSYTLQSPPIDSSTLDTQQNAAFSSGGGGGSVGGGGSMSTVNYQNREPSNPRSVTRADGFLSDVSEQQPIERKLLRPRYECLPQEGHPFPSSRGTGDDPSRAAFPQVSPTMNLPLPNTTQTQVPAWRGMQSAEQSPSIASLSNLPVDQRPQQPPRVEYSTLRTQVPRLEEHIQKLNGDQGATGSWLNVRFEVLTRACKDEDVFYVALHQVYCLWSLRRDVLSNITSLASPEVLRDAFGILSTILGNNDAFPMYYLQWFAEFPNQLEVSKTSTGYAQALSYVGNFLNSLVANFPTLQAEVRRRGYPPIVMEMVEMLDLRSTLLQSFIFRLLKRDLGFSDHDIGAQVEAIFHEDQNAWYTFSERANTSTAPTQNELQDHCANIKGRYLPLCRQQVARLAQQSAAGLSVPMSSSTMSTPVVFQTQGNANTWQSTSQRILDPPGSTNTFVNVNSPVVTLPPSGGSQPSSTVSSPIVYQQGLRVSMNSPLQGGHVPAPGQNLRNTSGGSVNHSAAYTACSNQQARSNTSTTQAPLSQHDANHLHLREQQSQQYLRNLQLQEQERQIMENQQQQMRLQQHRQAPDHVRSQQQQVIHQQPPQIQQNINHRAAFSTQQQTSLPSRANQQQFIQYTQQQQIPNQFNMQQLHQHQNVSGHQQAQRQQVQSMQQVLAMNRAYGRQTPPVTPAQVSTGITRSNGLPNPGSVTPGAFSSQRASLAATQSAPSQPYLPSEQQAYSALNPLQRPLIPPQGFNHPPQHPQPDYTALHQAHLRSPILVPPSPTTAMDQKPQRFYQYVSHCATGPDKLPVTLSVSNFRFRLDDAEFISLAKDEVVGMDPKRSVKRFFDSNTLQYRMRCIRVKPETTACLIEDWVVSDTTWPPTVFLELNGQPLEIRRKGQHGKDLPVDITNHVMSAGKGALNEVRISVPKTHKQVHGSSYFFAVEVISVLRHDEIMNRCLESQRIALGDTVEGIKKSLAGVADDDEIAMVPSDLTIDLRDPFSSSIFNIPARGKSCLHRECFDLETFLTTRNTKPKMPDQPVLADVWKCPICKADARPHNLRIDDFLVSVRVRLSHEDKLNVKGILVSADGTWKPKPEAESASRKRKAKTEDPDDDSDDNNDNNDTTSQARKNIITEKKEVLVIELDSD
ncbi:hypothetical protein BP6252_03072 [Coleophoma cylindrospora]|uniref:SP-RING-type domain-containing protein n=1 Tax=Coleophoma cylindrospora TaxID=1849047 RepID=A0A3D8S6Z2_9HELO|nr:hypothetical protein BP6252_03072 [Coleophoma cylindrospora]